MDIYSKTWRWKLILAITGIVIMLISLFYTNRISQKLADRERKKVELIAQVYESLLSTDDIMISSPDGEITDDSLNNEKNYNFEGAIIDYLKDVPVIMVDESGAITESQNFADDTDLKAELEKLKKSGLKPIEGIGYARYIYYKNTKLLTQLNYFPVFQFALLAMFILLGYTAFSAARKEEQNRVWVGMAKETAHQLGTPISGLMGWIEGLRSKEVSQDEKEWITQEMSNDVGKLELIAERFSKIGSAPELTPTNVKQTVEDILKYMEVRASKHVSFQLNVTDPHITASMNAHLVSWVIENIIRNALDATEGKGSITVSIYADSKYAHIDITDSGKGIPSSKFQTVFKPGFTTKQRGWGLGLSLAKRIIENYHRGKIFVKESTVGKGTTFSIQLRMTN